MSEKTVEIRLFDDNLRKYEEELVEIILNISKSKRVNPKVARIACYLLIHGKLTQKELKELTGFSMGTISTYLSVMAGTGYFQKQRIEGTHTFEYSFSGELETLTTQAIEFAIKHIGSFEDFLKNKQKDLKKLIEQSKVGAEHLSLRIEELLNSFEIYKIVYPYDELPVEKIQKKFSPKSFECLKGEQKDVKEIKYDPEVYIIEDDIITELIGSPMFSTRDPMFIKILGYFMTRKYLTQETLKNVTGLSAGKISEEVNQLLEDELIFKAHTSDKGKITYCADSLILLRFSRYIIIKMTKWVKTLENMKLELERNKAEFKDLNGYTQIHKIYDYVLSAISDYSKYIKRIDTVVNL
ncbi:MAG: hypothetical protein ACFE94_10785 [Candidatus Hodarchaeota archaeon]